MQGFEPRPKSKSKPRVVSTTQSALLLAMASGGLAPRGLFFEEDKICSCP